VHPRLLVVAALVLGMLATSGAGLPRVDPLRAQTATFSARADLVVLHVLVTDRHGGYVTGLGARHFFIRENRAPQTVQFFAAEDTPVTVGLLLDRSGSMSANRERVAAAAAAFAETSHPSDEIFALVFHERVMPALGGESHFTSDGRVLEAALRPLLGGRGGRTALYDALLGGFRYLEDGRHLRKALVVVSDGGDNASAATFDEASNQALASNVVLFTVGVVNPLSQDPRPGRLRQLARTTGGEAFMPRDVEAVGESLLRIAADLRHAYTVAYASTNQARDGRLREIQVAVRVPGRSGLHVRTRRAYRPGGE
jgi:Ca-activated chloride channel family protein